MLSAPIAQIELDTFCHGATGPSSLSFLSTHGLLPICFTGALPFDRRFIALRNCGGEN